ncbi:MAG: hypothetical protein ABW352_18635 [Polyangiales bacterium]
MRRFLPLLALALLHCSDDPEPATMEPSDETDAAERTDAGRDAGSLDARTPIDARVLDDARTPLDGRVSIEDARVSIEDARVVADATVADAGPRPSFDVQPNAPALSYLGTNGNDAACSRQFRTMGYAPSDGAKHPLFLYFVGTQFFAEDESPYYDSQAAKRTTEAMARRGFVAYSVEYDNQFTSFFADKTRCLYEDPNGLLKKACALPNVDCSLGVATWGHSQGGLIAHGAGNYDARVKATWTTGYSGRDDAKLPPDRLRVVNGEADQYNATLETLNKAAGTNCPEGDSCLRADGSGWIRVRKAASAQNSADHCWFDKRACSENTLNLEPNWFDPASTAAFSLEKNADWVAATVKRP